MYSVASVYSQHLAQNRCEECEQCVGVPRYYLYTQIGVPRYYLYTHSLSPLNNLSQLSPLMYTEDQFPHT